MMLMGATSLALALWTGCYIEQDVLVEQATSEKAGLIPNFRYAYFREDPARNRVHLRFTDYWNPCIADAQLQNRLRQPTNAEQLPQTPEDEAETYRALMPRRTWAADVYLQVDNWPEGSVRPRPFTITPQTGTDESGTPVERYARLCLLRQCPYEELCDECLPLDRGAVVGVTRTTDYLPVAYFRDDPFPLERVPQFAPTGTVDITVWNPAIPAGSEGAVDSGGSPTIDPTAQISGTLSVDLREVNADVDNGTMDVRFTATVCPEMQASYTPDRESFESRDVNAYGPPACRVGSDGAACALGIAVSLGLLRRRRRTTTTRSHDIAPPMPTGDS